MTCLKSLCDSPGLGFATPEISPFVCGSASYIFSASAAVSTHHYGSSHGPFGLCEKKCLKVNTHSGATPGLGLCEDTDSWPRSCWHLPRHYDSAASSAISLGLPQHCGISPRRGSDRNLCSASAAVSMHPCGSLGLCKKSPKLSSCDKQKTINDESGVMQVNQMS